jgi:hypothetical protein
MPINSFLYPGAKVVPPFSVANSLRFDGSSANLSRTKGTSDSTKIGTYSWWIKNSKFTGQNLIDCGDAFANSSSVYISSSNTLTVFSRISNSNVLVLETDREFRDPAAWHNIVVAIDTTQGTASNRVKVYVDGVQQTSFSTETYPDQNADLRFFTSSETEKISSTTYESGGYFGGYMCEVVKVDGQALAPTSFGEFDEDSPTIWKPIDVAGLTFGTNGYYLDFEDSSNLGNNVSGGSDFTANNLQSLDQCTDTCTNNFCTWNPLIVRIGRTAVTFSEGNVKAQHNDTGGNTPSWGTFLLNSGKWYWEVKITSAGIIYCGVWQPGYNNGDVDDALNGIVVYRTDGNKQAETAATAASYGNSFTTGDIIGVAVDVDTGTIWFSKNGTWQNSATISEIGAGTTTNSAYTGKSFATNGIIPSVSAYQSSGNAIVEANFGGGTSFTVSSGNADANGFGNFEYAVPSGYFSLCSKNLAEFG